VLNLDHIPFGGDYNPEQWTPDVWARDDAAFAAAHVTTWTVGVFAWALLQPDEAAFDFSSLDATFERAERTGRDIVLATPTGAVPPWLATAHPDVLRTDFEGRAHAYGQRHNACPSSRAFAEASVRIAGKLAERYAGRPVAWHVGNEHGGACYCPNCAAGFRRWLRARYGTLDALNDAWNTTFWSHVFTAWDQVVPPNALSEHWRGEDHTAFHGITLDYRRFMTDAMLERFTAEKAAIRRFDPGTPVTTNLMGAYRPLDYHRWAPALDFASWDNYPPTMRSEARMALTHDLVRGLKDGAPFWLMEQTPSRTAARDVNPLKPPGVMRLWSWQAIAHGADACCFFQMRASRGACEKDHGALIGHAGRAGGRVFAEMTALGEEVGRVGPALLDARTPARAALLFDWDSWWALEMADGPNRHVRYLDVLVAWYAALWRLGVPLDVVPVAAELARYDVVLAPVLHLVKDDVADRLAGVVARGGSVVTGVLSGRVDASARAFLADDPGPLGGLAGVVADETDAREPGVAVPVRLSVGPVPEASGTLVFELLVPADEHTRIVGTYGGDWFAGATAVTRRSDPATGGECWYVGTVLDDAGLDAVLGEVAARCGLVDGAAPPPGVERTVRVAPDGTVFTFVLNHNDADATWTVPADATDLLTGDAVPAGRTLVLAPHGVRVLAPDGRPGRTSASVR